MIRRTVPLTRVSLSQTSRLKVCWASAETRQNQRDYDQHLFDDAPYSEDRDALFCIVRFHFVTHSAPGLETR